MTPEPQQPKRRRWRTVVVAVGVGFLAPIAVNAVLFAIRLHLTGDPEMDVAADRAKFPGIAIRSGIAGAWIAGLVTCCGWQDRASFWRAFGFIATPAFLAAAVVQDRRLATYSSVSAPLIASLIGAAAGAGYYCWRVSQASLKPSVTCLPE